MNLGPQIVKDTYQYLLLQSGNSPVRKGDNSSVDFNSAGIVSTTGNQTISGAKTFTSAINGLGSYTGFTPFSAIIGGSSNIINSSQLSFIGGGFTNTLISGADQSSILGGSVNRISTNSESCIIGGRNNSISGSFNSSAIIGGNSCSTAESNCLAHGKGALAYNQGSRVQSADFFASIGDAQYVEANLIGALARVGSGTVSSTTYSGELVLDLVTLKRFNIPGTKVFSGRVSILVVGPNNFTASYSFPFVTHRDDGTSIYPLNSIFIMGGITNESVTTGSNNRFSTASPYITITRLSSGFAIRCDVVVIGTSGQPSNSAIGLRAVGRVFGLECSAANTSSYY